MPAAGPDSFYAEIPAQSLGRTIHYCLRAADNSGRIEYHPLVGPLGPHRFRVRLDEEPPSIDHDPVADISELAWPPSAAAVIKDDVSVPEAAVEWFLNGEGQASRQRRVEAEVQGARGARYERTTGAT